MSESLRIAMFVGCFPVVSETFILRQITGLIDLGHHVDIFADACADTVAPVHPEIANYRLLERATFMDMPPETAPWEMPVWPITGKTWTPGATTPIPNWRRVVSALPRWLQCASRSPRLSMEVLQTSKYGFRASSLSTLYRAAKLCAINRRYDVVHAHFGPVGNNFRFARALWRAPFIVTFHGYDFCVVPREEGPDVYRHLFEMADAVTVNCEYTGQQVARLGCPSERIHRLHVGVDVSQFAFGHRMRTPGEPVQLISVGRLVEKKGIEYGIRAIAQVIRKYPELRYDVIGDGPLRASLEKLVQELGLNGKVVLHGAQDSDFVRQRMAEAHVFVLTSVTALNGDQEGTPVSLMEAQAAGLPVLSTRHSGIPEVVLDGESGFLLPEHNVDALAAKLEILIENPELCARMGVRGRQHVKEHFDLRRLNRDLVDIYQRARVAYNRSTVFS
jgi:colanic acid/amylovoran biosynthesis glycosyltransferase